MYVIRNVRKKLKREMVQADEDGRGGARMITSGCGVADTDSCGGRDAGGCVGIDILE